jgi:hypothetical protein
MTLTTYKRDMAYLTGVNYGGRNAAITVRTS